MEDLDAGENGDGREKRDGSGASPAPGLSLSARRERKKSRYLSPPYTSLGRSVLKEKPADLPKELPPSAAKKDVKKKSVGAREVLLLVRRYGKDIFHERHFPNAAEGFLGLLRSSAFAEGADHSSYKEHKCPAAENTSADVPIAGLVSDSGAPTKQSKRGRKKDPDVGGGSSLKRKMEEKTSPKATLGRGIVITPAIPIRQVRAEDIISQVKSGGGAGMRVGVPDHNNRLVFRSPFSAAVSGGIRRPGVGIGIQVDMNVQSGIVDVPARSVQMEAMELEANVLVDTNDEQGGVADVPPLGLADMRKNVDNMISSLKNGHSPLATARAKPVPENLLGEMQRLQSKLDKMQPGACSSASATP